MKILFLSGSRSRAAGGIFEVERSLAGYLHHRHQIKVDAAGFADESAEEDRHGWGEIETHCFPRYGPKQFGYSPGLAKWLRFADHDLLHLHNLWMYTSWLAMRWHERTGRPFLVSPHGMLDPWALKHSGLKKRIARVIYEGRMLSKAKVIHAFHLKDLADIRAFGLRNPVAVIPNGVELPDISNVSSTRRENSILFLGRLHPKKGLGELIKAWSKLDLGLISNWKLKIAGWDDGGHLGGLRDLVLQLGLSQSIEFLGPAFGKHKENLLASSSGFILPSFSEGLPMTVLEAWAFELPVLMTDACNLPQGFEENAAIKIVSTPQDIAYGLAKFLNMPEDQRRMLGMNGRKLVQRVFTWNSVADQMTGVYRWMLGEADRPDCVYSVANSRD